MKTHRRVLWGLCAAVGLSSLLGCGSVLEGLSDSREQTLTNVMGDTWQLTAVWPNEPMIIHVRNHLNLEANKYCYRTAKRGALLLESASEQINDGKGSKSTIVFRCVHRLDGPERRSIFSDDDSK